MSYLRSSIAVFLFVVIIGSPISVYADGALSIPSNDKLTPTAQASPDVLAKAQAGAESLVAAKNALPDSGALNLQATQAPELFLAGSPDGTTNVLSTTDAQGRTVLVFRNAVNGQLIKSVTLDAGVTGVTKAQFTADSQNVFVFENTQNGKQLAFFDKNGNARGELSSKLWTITSDTILWTTGNNGNTYMIGTTNGNFAYVPTVGLCKVLGLSANKNVFLSKTFDAATNRVTEHITEIVVRDGQMQAPKTYAVNSYAYNPNKLDLTYLVGFFGDPNDMDKILFVTTDPATGYQRIRAMDCSRPLYDSYTTLGPIHVLSIRVDNRGRVTMTFERGGSIKVDYTFTIGGGK